VQVVFDLHLRETRFSPGSDLPNRRSLPTGARHMPCALDITEMPINHLVVE
jgi:hypothetical protein